MNPDDKRPFGLDLNKWFITGTHPDYRPDWVILPARRPDLPKTHPVRFSSGAEALAAFAAGGEK